MENTKALGKGYLVHRATGVKVPINQRELRPEAKAKLKARGMRFNPKHWSFSEH